MQYIICDDNQEFANDFKLQLIEEEPDCTVMVCYSVEQLNGIISAIAPSTDAVFMDIQLQKSYGIDEAIHISEKFPDIKIVYITGYPEKYSEQIFCCPSSMTPTAFLIKPIKKEMLKNTLARLKEKTPPAARMLLIKKGQDQILVPIDDILFVSVMGRKLTIKTLNDLIEINGRLSEYMKQLPEYFVQCHKSYCINIRHIRKIHSRNEVLLSNGESIPVSRGYAVSFMDSVTAMYNALSM